MVYVDVDSDGTTFNSSRATLRDLPPSINVLWAGLYWTADTTAGKSGANARDASKKNQVLFQTPATGGYVPIAASSPCDVSTSSGEDYACFADVTSLVNTARGGLYTVANVQAGTGEDRQAGWILLVAMEDQGLPLRNLVVFDGYAEVRNAPGEQEQVITVSGFLTPASGTVNTRLGLAATEGDLGLTGDSFSFKDASSSTFTKLSTSTSPTDNFHNSVISDLGLIGEGSLPKFPDYVNQLGFGADRVQANGILKNNSTTAQVKLSTVGDTYAPFVVTVATDIFEPQIRATKTVTDLNGGSAVPGDVLEYTVTVTNSGPDAATNVVLRDQIPPLTGYLAGSLAIDGVPKSDALGDDQAFFNSPDDRVVFNLGTGATATAGGTLTQNQSSTITFRVTVNGDVPDARVISNDAVVQFRTATLQSDVRLGSNSVDVTTVNRADLRIAKTTTQDALTVGESRTFTLTATNAGPLPATARVIDHLPAGFSFVSATPSQGGPCVQDGVLLTCPLGLLDVNASATIQVVLRATEAGTAENTAVIDTLEPNRIDPDLTNNVSSVTVFVNSSADVAITKTQSSETLKIGETQTYTLQVTNNGPSPATDVTLTDPLATARVSLVSALASQGTCTGTSQVTCALGTLNVGASATVTLVVRATSAGPLPNAAEVRATEPDPNVSNNSATTGAIVTPPEPVVLPTADLSIVKTAASATGTVGQPFTYQIAVANNGPDQATGVLLTETLPNGVLLVSVTPSQGSCGTTQQFTCSLGTVSSGGKATVTVVVTAQQAGTFTNLATVAGNETDPNPDNNVASASASANGDADLALVKQATPNPVDVGGTLQYRIAIRNNGPAEATDVLFEDRLPAGVTLLQVRVSQGTCTVTNVISCNIGRLANGAGARVGIAVRVDREGPLLNAARVTAAQPDPNVSNNVAVKVVEASTIEPESVVDLVVTKVASAATVKVGDTVTFTVTVANSSGSDATGVILTDTLPQGAVLVSATPSQGSCTGTGIVECALGTLAGGSTASVSVVVRATSPGPFDNVASVVANESDANPDNDEATARVTVEPTPPTPTPPSAAGLQVTKTASTTTPLVGDTVTFAISVANTSASAVSGVTLTDALPAGLDFVSATPGQGACTGTVVVTCNLGTIPAGRTVVVNVVVRVGAASVFANTATASAPGQPNAQGSVTITAGELPPPKPDDDDKDRERRDERRRREAQERQEHEEEETQGNVVAVVCTDSELHPPERVAQDDGIDIPYVVIVTIDGNQKVRLRGRYAIRACQSIRVGDYLEANGEKQTEVLFDADDVTVRGARP